MQNSEKKHYIVIRNGTAILRTSSIGYAVKARIKMLELQPEATIEILDDSPIHTNHPKEAK